MVLVKSLRIDGRRLSPANPTDWLIGPRLRNREKASPGRRCRRGADLNRATAKSDSHHTDRRNRAVRRASFAYYIPWIFHGSSPNELDLSRPTTGSLRKQPCLANFFKEHLLINNVSFITPSWLDKRVNKAIKLLYPLFINL